MGKDCCNMKVTETEDGINIEIKGKDIKEKCKVMMDKCCDDESIQKIVKTCCESVKKDDKNCCK